MDDFNEDEFDEFDEFKNFNREELNKLFRDRMADEDFRKKFMGIVGGYQRDFDSIMKLIYGGNNPFSGMSTPENPNNDSFLSGLDFKSLDEDNWMKDSWTNDQSHFTSFTRSFTPEEFYNETKKPQKENKLPTDVVIKILQDKLADSLEEENYEEAASLRDTIMGLKEGERSKNEKKEEKE